jgi:CRISPR-associated protein (TIGR02584 family)
MKAKHWETVVIAVLGVSPSVLTETLWALAQESPPILPDRIVVLKLGTGKQPNMCRAWGCKGDHEGK